MREGVCLTALACDKKSRRGTGCAQHPDVAIRFAVISFTVRRISTSRLSVFALEREASSLEELDVSLDTADWMSRNLSHRVEVVAPVVDPVACERLWEILDVSVKDRRQAWLLDSDGHGWARSAGGGGLV
jgi:polyphosphate kinase